MLALPATRADSFAHESARYYIWLSIHDTLGREAQGVDSLGSINISRPMENVVSKLFKLRDWFTIKDAAVHLSSAMSEPVMEADVLRLVMDGYLKVSLFLGHEQFAVPSIALSRDDFFDLPSTVPHATEIERWDPAGSTVPRPDSAYLQPDSRFFHLLQGVYDFPLAGRQSALVEREYFRLTGGPVIDRARGLFVLMNEKPSIELPNGKAHCEVEGKPLLRLVDVENGKATMLSELPAHSVFVIRAEALQQFTQSLAQPVDEEKALATRSKNNYLGIIGALTDLYWKGIYGEAPYSQTKMLEDLEPYKGFPGHTEHQTHLKSSLTLAMQLINQK